MGYGLERNSEELSSECNDSHSSQCNSMICLLITCGYSILSGISDLNRSSAFGQRAQLQCNLFESCWNQNIALNVRQMHILGTRALAHTHTHTHKLPHSSRIDQFSHHIFCRLKCNHIQCDKYLFIRTNLYIQKCNSSLIVLDLFLCILLNMNRCLWPHVNSCHISQYGIVSGCVHTVRLLVGTRMIAIYAYAPEEVI